MSTTTHLNTILNERTSNQQWIDDTQLEKFVDAILAARHVFLAGAGRSGVARQGFANRLMHLRVVRLAGGRYDQSPHRPRRPAHRGIGSDTPRAWSRSARRRKPTACRSRWSRWTPASTIGQLADVVVVLPGVSPKVRGDVGQITSVQPMGSAFEQITALTYDAVVLELMQRTGQTSEDMFERHANLE